MSQTANMFLVMGNFHQPSESVAAEMGIPGANMLGTRDFLGIISLQADDWSGQMNDHWGRSDLTDITFEPEDKLIFTKRYARRRDFIAYELRWNAVEKWWEGDWKLFEDGRAADWGLARLYLVPTSPEFFAYNGVSAAV